MKEEKKHIRHEKKTTRLDNGVCPAWTMSPGLARSMGRPSFIKWHEKKRIPSSVTYLYHPSGKWLRNGDFIWRNG